MKILIATTLLLVSQATMAAPSVDEELRRVDAQIREHELAAAADETAWLPLERLALAYLRRARLGGEHEDYQRARASLEAAFERAPNGAGPHLTRARVMTTLHRTRDARRALESAEQSLLLDDPTRAAIAGLRGEIALAHGQLAQARDDFERALELDPGYNAVANLALWYQKAGRRATAAQLYRHASALAAGSPLLEAWCALQIGELAREAGDARGARRHYARAERILPGWKLVASKLALLESATTTAGK